MAGERLTFRDRLDPIQDKMLLLPVKIIETASTEENILREGSLVIGFAPHSGWAEVPTIDLLLRGNRADKRGALWISKEENRKIIPPWFLNKNRVVYMNREKPQTSVFKKALRTLDRGGVVASAIEGTRFGTGDREGEDFKTMSKAKAGLVYISYKSRAPIQATIVKGAENLIPNPEKIIEERGMVGLLIEFVKKAIERDVEMQVRFLPTYSKHLTEESNTLKGKQLVQFVDYHSHVLAELMAEKIREIDPQYPIGAFV